MPSTREILGELQYDAQGFAATGSRGLLFQLNEVHRYMQSGDCWEFIYVDPTTGRPPILSTTSPTRRYNCPADCRKVFDLALDSLSTANRTVFYNYYNRFNGYYRAPKDFIFGNWQYVRMEAHSTSATQALTATVTFPFDPDTTTDTYYLFYFKKPAEILNATIELEVPEKFHDLVMDGVLAKIGKKQYGKEDAWRYWQKVVIPKYYWAEMNKPHQPITNYVPQRQC